MWKDNLTFKTNGCKKQAGAAILISNKLKFKLKLVKRGEDYFIFFTGKNTSR